MSPASGGDDSRLCARIRYNAISRPASNLEDHYAYRKHKEEEEEAAMAVSSGYVDDTQNVSLVARSDECPPSADEEREERKAKAEFDYGRPAKTSTEEEEAGLHWDFRLTRSSEFLN